MAAPINTLPPPPSFGAHGGKVPTTDRGKQTLALALQNLANGVHLDRDQQLVLHYYRYGYYTKAGEVQYGARSTGAQGTAGMGSAGAQSSLATQNSAGGAVQIPVDERVDTLLTGSRGALSDQDVLDQVVNGLQSRLPVASADPAAPSVRIGNPSNVALWNLDQAASLNRGIKTAQQFFPNIAPADLAHLIIAEGLHESTGDMNKNVGGDAGAGMGFMQATPQSVVKDYLQFGTQVKAPDGSVVLDPSVPINLADPGQNVALFAWYTYNSLAAGGSLEGVLKYNNAPTVDPADKDYGNIMLTWLGGPSNDRHQDGGQFDGSEYIKQTQDYFTESGFGTAEQFRALLSTPTGQTLKNVKGSV